METNKFAVSNASIEEPAEVHPGQNIVVAVRVRPLSSKELTAGQKPCCSAFDEKTVTVKKCGDNSAYLKSQVQDTINNFVFDHVFDEESTQQEIYLKTIQKFVPKIHLGQHVTVFAYGATGAGKTYTMFGQDLESNHDFTKDSNSGIIIRAVKDLLEQTEQRKKMSPSGEVWITSFCFMEVYNEQVFDLLQYTGKNLTIREDADKNIIQVTGLSETVIESVNHFIELMRHGQKHRKMESTLANTVSSRSHAILQVIVRCIQRNKYGKETLTESKLSLIDLAGSERASRTGNSSGARQQEGANINKSLLALSNCINALAENFSLPAGTRTSQKVNVKFRDSKLTHLLKASLEGNSHLVMLANINPSDVTYEDSLKTLYYAKRAKCIKVNPLARTNLLEATSLEREIQLRAENEDLRKRVEEHESEVSSMQETIQLLEQQLAESLQTKELYEEQLRIFIEKEEIANERRNNACEISCQADLDPETEEVSCQVLPYHLEGTNEISCQTEPIVLPKMCSIACQTSADLLPSPPEAKIVTIEVPVEKIVEKIVEKVIHAPAPEPVIVQVQVPAPKPETCSMECQTDLPEPVTSSLTEEYKPPSFYTCGSMAASAISKTLSITQSRESILQDDEMDLDQIYFVNELRKMKKKRGKKVTYDPSLIRSHTRSASMEAMELPAESLSPTSRTVREKIEQFERYSPSARKTATRASAFEFPGEEDEETEQGGKKEKGDLFIYRLNENEEEKEDVPDGKNESSSSAIVFHKVLIEEEGSCSSAESRLTEEERLFFGSRSPRAHNRSNESLLTFDLLDGVGEEGTRPALSFSNVKKEDKDETTSVSTLSDDLNKQKRNEDLTINHTTINQTTTIEVNKLPAKKNRKIRQRWMRLFVCGGSLQEEMA